MNDEGRRPPAHPVRGTLIALVAVPAIVVGGLLVLVTLVSLVITGLDPRNWLSPNAGDWLWGMGVVGDAGHFVRLMIGTLLAGGGVSALRWGYHGGQR